MDADDLLVGRVLSRREAVRLLTIAGAGALAGCAGGAGGGAAVDSSGAAAASAAGGTALPACVVRPELAVGPYFVDQQLDRSDIRPEPSTGAASAGVPLALAFTVSRVDGGRCAPLAGALVDLWQCDARGVYSAVVDREVGFDTRSEKFLRGHQTTDAAGTARFVTVYPGWYPGRTVHIHFKVRAPAAAAGSGAYEFTSQLFFDDALSDRILADPAYARAGARDTTNATDGIFREVGDQLLLKPVKSAEGYAATFAIGLDLSDAATGRPDRDGGSGGPPPGGGRRPGEPPPRRPGNG